YQTAHRVITELEEEGLLERRQASGTYIAGRAAHPRSVELWFHPRAQRRGSYGAHLLALLKKALADAGVNFSVCWSKAGDRPAANSYPVLWESPGVLKRVMAVSRYALVLNDRPAPGLAASMVDAVATDDFSAGVCAAQVLCKRPNDGSRFSVLAGPRDDERSKIRVAGFLSRLPQAGVVNAGSWFFEDAQRVAARVLAQNPAGVFCVNDRLAEALLACCREQGRPAPPVVGHDNAPVAEELHLTTIETPWAEMVDAAVAVIRSRLDGNSRPARQIILAQRPVYRLTVPVQ
ncbi:MAG: substrate-binding domain-containing protein, partial [Verrucomicrobia bacterium]|nr:substrate-binding domain-containing protein [Verrucomicrobiota bacterium]